MSKTHIFNVSVVIGKGDKAKEYLKGTEVPIGKGDDALSESEIARIEANFGRFVDGVSKPVPAPDPKTGDAEEVAALKKQLSANQDALKARDEALKKAGETLKERDEKITALQKSNEELDQLLAAGDQSGDAKQTGGQDQSNKSGDQS